EPERNAGIINTIPSRKWLETAVTKNYVAAAEILYGIMESDGYWLRLPMPDSSVVSPPGDDGHTYVGVYLRQLEHGLRFPLHPFIVELLTV
ncbi:hypothetical protein ABTH76_20680, partial [Acinetobacter baumannii]